MKKVIVVLPNWIVCVIHEWRRIRGRCKECGGKTTHYCNETFHDRCSSCGMYV